MKNEFKVLTVLLAMAACLSCGYMFGKSQIKECTRKHQNIIPDGRIVIIPVGEVEGRAKYNVLFNDEDYMENMYAEEIANGLITDDWDYNEDLRVK